MIEELNEQAQDCIGQAVAVLAEEWMSEEDYHQSLEVMRQFFAKSGAPVLMAEVQVEGRRLYPKGPEGLPPELQALLPGFLKGVFQPEKSIVVFYLRHQDWQHHGALRHLPRRYGMRLPRKGERPRFWKLW